MHTDNSSFSTDFYYNEAAFSNIFNSLTLYISFECIYLAEIFMSIIYRAFITLTSGKNNIG